MMGKEPPRAAPKNHQRHVVQTKIHQRQPDHHDADRARRLERQKEKTCNTVDTRHRMAPGTGTKTPVPRTRTGCLTCRKRKVKCDEVKPVCSRCQRLERECVWSEELQVTPQGHHSQYSSPTFIASTATRDGSILLCKPSGQSFVVEFPNVNRVTIPYIHHFVTYCCRFLAYSNDSEGNPFQEALVPLAGSSPALLHSMAAVAAGHLARTQGQHQLVAAKYYSMALLELNSTLSDPVVARSDATLGACLLLCVYEISHSENCLWLQHLQGARDLIVYRGGPNPTDYLSRFFSLLDVSGSLTIGGGPLIKGNYWLEDEIVDENGNKLKGGIPNWPAYDPHGVMTNNFHILMIFMAKLSILSSDSMEKDADPVAIKTEALRISNDVSEWWRSCPPALGDQRNDWRRQIRLRKLTVSETLEEEAFSSTKSCMYGCVIYLNHLIDPLGRSPQVPEVTEAIDEILSIAQETPEGYGLEMGIYWGLFMVGISIFNDPETEDLLRRKLTSDTTVSIYHADRALELLEVLWGRQHQYGCKYDWRQVQNQMGTQVFILA